jgi:hypothetical protein
MPYPQALLGGFVIRKVADCEALEGAKDRRSSLSTRKKQA